MNTSRHSLDLSIIGLLALGLGLVIGLFLGHVTYSTPSYLSIKASDKAFIDDLANEALSNGECVKVVPLAADSNGFRWYWLHSCNP